MTQHISVVIPVFQGENTIRNLVNEISKYLQVTSTPNGNKIIICEIILVHDCGPDNSDAVINLMAESNSKIKAIWLTRNFGQHAATLAGMSSASGDWVVTMDEDGQHNPDDIPHLIDTAYDKGLQLVYAKPLNRPPHGFVRNLTSRLSKIFVKLLINNKHVEYFHSYRLVRGNIARSLAAYCGQGIYLDIGLLWIAGRIGQCPLNMRSHESRASSYSYRSLLRLFWNMLITAGTKPLRFITLVGITSVSIALSITFYVLYQKLMGNIAVQGWASIVLAISFFSGCILISLGLISEYLAISMGIAMGKPLYVISNRSNRNLDD